MFAISVLVAKTGGTSRWKRTAQLTVTGSDAGWKVHVAGNTQVSHRKLAASTIPNTLLDNSTETLTVFLHFWLIPVTTNIIINSNKRIAEDPPLLKSGC